MLGPNHLICRPVRESSSSPQKPTSVRSPPKSLAQMSSPLVAIDRLIRFLLPLCCHAFHTDCIDAWLSSNQTCPLCKSDVYSTEEDVLNKIISSMVLKDHGNNFRIEIGSMSRRQGRSDSSDGRRSYSIGSFDYIVDEGYKVSIDSTHQRGLSDYTSVSKDSSGNLVVVSDAEREFSFKSFG
ncbi:E3 ubiquitin-protein ligase ATL4 [Camellia lanceoleosa]|uniref:E3 ubiquitin-protein ligase ATL4 n=1 Tax=Camellia lanceoleosa TaxID=1840588 RepID=A0ACC0GZX5_9ERIC|nr:E3 ubiquitin-protein ligase ATL4 [Camellia lanceoleosa]